MGKERDERKDKQELREMRRQRGERKRNEKEISELQIRDEIDETELMIKNQRVDNVAITAECQASARTRRNLAILLIVQQEDQLGVFWTHYFAKQASQRYIVIAEL